MSEHSTRGHAELGGSGADRWVNCSGSVFLLREVNAQEASDAMLEGTKAHEAAEKLLASFLHHRVTGEVLPLNLDIPAEMQEHVEGYKDFVWNDLLEQSITDKVYDLETAITIDEQLNMWGSADFWCFSYDDRGKRCAVICDFKYGRKNVEAESNVQIAFYLVALRKELRKQGMDIDYGIGAIYQPRSFTNSAPKKTKVTAKELDTWEKRFYKAAHQIYVAKKPKFKIGKWCEMCRAKHLCKAYAKESELNTSLKLVDVEKIETPKVESLPKEVIARIALNYDMVKSFLDECFDYALKQAKTSGMPGIKVVESSKGKRSWISDTNLVIDTLIHNGVSEENITEAKLKGIGELEKLLRKQVSKEDAEEIMSKITVKGRSTETIVALDDPRPAIAGALSMLNETPIEGVTGDVFIKE